MLQNLRNHFPRWLVATLLGLLGLLLVLGGLYNPSDASSWSARKVLVRVNKKKIRLSQVERVYVAMKEQAAAEGNIDFSSERANEVRMAILQQLIVRELLRQHAYTSGYRLDPRDTLAVVRTIPNLQVDGEFSSQRFKAMLAAMGMTRTAFLKEIADDSVMRQASAAIIQSAFLFPKEVNQYIRLSEQQRDFVYLTLETRHFTPDKSELPMEELRAYYDQHLTQFRVPEQVSIDYVLLSRTDMLSQLKAKYPDDTQAAEAEAVQNFKAAVEQLSKLSSKRGNSLTKVAEVLHLDMQSTDLFGKAGGSHAITRQPEVIAAAFSEALRQGRNSALIQLDENRVVVLRLKEYRPLRLSELVEVESSVRVALSAQKAKEAVREYGKRLLEKMKENPAEAVDVPKHCQWKDAKRVKRNNQEVNPEILANAFAIPYQGEAVPVRGVSLANGDYVIIRLSKVRPGQASQLEDGQRDAYRQSLLTEINQLSHLQYLQASEKRAKVVR